MIYGQFVGCLGLRVMLPYCSVVLMEEDAARLAFFLCCVLAAVLLNKLVKEIIFPTNLHGLRAAGVCSFKQISIKIAGYASGL